MVTAIQANTATSPRTHTTAATLRAMVELGRPPRADDPATVEQTAAQMLSELFFKPMLEEMRKFPFGRELATGGQTEAVFGQRLDERVADQVAHRTPGLIRQLVHQLEKPAPDAAPPARPQPPDAGAQRSYWPAELRANSPTARGEP